MKGDKLTPKQEKFCAVYFETGNASEAYRQAYSAKGMKEKTIGRMAFDLLQNRKITAKVRELKDLAAKTAVVTVLDLVNELEESRKLALSKLDVSTAIAATMGKAKLLGFGAPDQNTTINNVPVFLNIHPVKSMGQIGG